jgi:hypothetical protein
MNKFIALVLLFISVEACSKSDITWKTDGSVSFGNNVIKLKMQNAYFGYKFNNGIYIIGFEIDKEGNNTPTLAWLNGQDKKPVYWAFDSVLQEIFVSDGQVSLLDIAGELYKLDQQQWVKLDLKLKPNSRIINADNGIIACNPAPLIKVTTDYGACYSVAGKWEVKVNWRETMPKLCGDYLVAVEESQKGLTLKQYNKLNGDLASSKMLKKVPADLCSIIKGV